MADFWVEPCMQDDSRPGMSRDARAELRVKTVLEEEKHLKQTDIVQMEMHESLVSSMLLNVIYIVCVCLVFVFLFLLLVVACLLACLLACFLAFLLSCFLAFLLSCFLVCLFVCLFVCLLACLFVCLFVMVVSGTNVSITAKERSTVAPFSDSGKLAWTAWDVSKSSCQKCGCEDICVVCQEAMPVGQGIWHCRVGASYWYGRGLIILFG